MSAKSPRPASAGVVMTDAQRMAWMRLIRSENVGPQTFRSLINHYGSAQAALVALPDLARRGGIDRRIKIASEAEIEREWVLARAGGARFVGLGEPDYPRALRAIDGPPPILAIRGGAGPAALAEASLFVRPMVAIVGSRNASLAGRKIAAQIARGLGEAGFVVASGLARGIDASAHEASLMTGTIAVLAGGLDRIYPPEHQGLADRLVEAGGALISEMPFGWEPRARDFPRRNRLISGLGLGVVVVEAAAKSGSLHTARFAAEQGRDVLAVPGSPLDPRAEGSNDLLRHGATLVCSAEHVIEALTPLVERGPPEPIAYEPEDDGLPPPEAASDAARKLVIEALGPTPIAVDDIIRATGVGDGMVQLVLVELALAGRLERHGQGRVSLVM